MQESSLLTPAGQVGGDNDNAVTLGAEDCGGTSNMINVCPNEMYGFSRTTFNAVSVHFTGETKKVREA